MAVEPKDQTPAEKKPQTATIKGTHAGHNAEAEHDSQSGSVIIPEEIPVEAVEIIEKLNADDARIIVRAFSVIQSGPLPSGREIQIYNKEIPNGGDRLMKNAETQLAHRIEIEKSSVTRTFGSGSV
jgi:hypothetical protein